LSIRASSLRCYCLCSSVLPPPPRSTLFPYTTLFRSKEITAAEAAAIFADFYRDSFFVRLVEGSPDINWVKTTNFCDIGFAIEVRSEEHTSELQSHLNLVCRLLLEKKKKKN